MKRCYFIIYGLVCFGIGNAQFTVLHNFNDTSGNPTGDLTLVGNVLYGMTNVNSVMPPYFGSIFVIDTDGRNYKVLHEFDSLHGYAASSYGSLTYASGVLYGMTSAGGINNIGNIFSIDTNGNNYKDLFDFDSINGAYPAGSLTLSGGRLYGMTFFSGKHGYGDIFSIDTNGTGFKDLYDFSGSSGAEPYGSLTLSGKVLYGMTSVGGGFGNIFSIDTNGSGYKNLFDFSGSPFNGSTPYGSLTLSRGVLFGMTPSGGSDNFGTIFSIDSDGFGFDKILDFSGSIWNGALPYGSLTLSGSLLYGMTTYTIFSIDTNGSKFKKMFNFNNVTGYTEGSLTLSGSTLYGMTENGGTNNMGVIFKIDTSAVADINELKNENGDVKVYPNPTTGQFMVSLSNINEKCDVEVFNVFGQKVYSAPFQVPPASSTCEINLSKEPEGVYFYRVFKEDEIASQSLAMTVVGQGKIIIEK